jgi:hypothetical protein
MRNASMRWPTIRPAGKDLRECLNNLREGGVELPANQSYAGHPTGGGIPPDSTRLREITEDRPSPCVQTYTLATPAPVNAAEQARVPVEASADLSWHRELVKIRESHTESQKSLTNDKVQEQAAPTPAQQPDQQHPREPQGRGGKVVGL